MTNASAIGPSADPRTALVTGASAGLGLALATQLLSEEWHVIGIDRDEAAAGTDGHAHYLHIPLDLSDPAALDAVMSDLPPLDLAILSAGISATGRFEAIPRAAHSRLLAVNASAPLVMADALLAGRMRSGARVVLIGSLATDVGYPGAASYAASKDALAAYARSVRKPAAKRGVGVELVLPGPIRTDHAERHAPPGAKANKRMAPADLARRILRNRRAVLRPGVGAALGGAFGRLMPRTAARLMRRVLFAKLDREVF